MKPRYTEGAEAERQLAGFIAKFDEENARLIALLRKALRKRMPHAIEQVYDNYNFLAIGFCTTERTSDCVVSLAAGPNGVSLSFYRGADLPDPEGVLEGAGKQNRFIRLKDGKALSNPSIERLVAEAILRAPTPMPSSGKGKTMIKSVSAKQRSRRRPPIANPSARS